MRVVYFTIVPLVDEGNGGSICCRNHVRRLAADPGIELSVIAAGPPARQQATLDFLASIAVPGRYVVLNPDNIRPEGHAVGDLTRFAAAMLLQTPWDLQALNQQHVSAAVDQAVVDFAAERLVIDYTPSALYVRLPRTDVETVLVKLNREIDFFRDYLDSQPTRHGRWTRTTSLVRWRRKEQALERHCSRVIALSELDLPRHLPPGRSQCITPYLDRPTRWAWTGSRRVAFVGNIHHFPNRGAVAWMATRLAPLVERLDPGISFHVVGAPPEQADPAWIRPNVHFNGFGDSASAEWLLLQCDLALCPVANDYGVKFKAAEALAYGTPLLASEQTLAGLPYLPAAPALRLDDPQASAETLVGLLASRETLIAFQEEQARRHADFVHRQQGIWAEALSTAA